jgi:hypothetical protein
MTNDELLEVIQQAARDGVMKLDLTFKGLTSLPKSIGQLMTLTWLDLSFNQLTSLPESEASKYRIKAKNVQIVENNTGGEVIAEKYATDPAFTETLTQIVQILATLQQNHPTATQAEAEDIIEAEIVELKTKQPNKWQTFRRELFSRERWLNGGKAALTETGKHYADKSAFYKALIAFFDRFTANED